MDEPLGCPLRILSRKDIDAAQTKIADRGIVRITLVLVGMHLIPESLGESGAQCIGTDHITGEALCHIYRSVVAQTEIKHHLVHSHSLHLRHDSIERLLIMAMGIHMSLDGTLRQTRTHEVSHKVVIHTDNAANRKCHILHIFGMSQRDRHRVFPI